MKIITCNSNRPLAENIAKELNTSLMKAEVKTFQDKEIFVEIFDNVRGEDVFLVQSTSAPANDNLMELLITIDALKRGSAKRITAVMPYFGYARQDRKTGPRTPISAKLCADLLTRAGAHRVLTIDLHATQIQGFFDVPVDNLFAGIEFNKHITANYDIDNLVIVSPDVGGVLRARSTAKNVQTSLAIIDKRRERAGVSEVMNIIGDIKGKDCILMDDIIDSAGTLCNAADALMAQGAKSVDAYVSHGVLSGKALDKINASHLNKLVITDTIKPTKAMLENDKIHYLSVATLLAQAITCIHKEKSISALFDQ